MHYYRIGNRHVSEAFSCHVRNRYKWRNAVGQYCSRPCLPIITDSAGVHQASTPARSGFWIFLRGAGFVTLPIISGPVHRKYWNRPFIQSTWREDRNDKPRQNKLSIWHRADWSLLQKTHGLGVAFAVLTAYPLDCYHRFVYFFVNSNNYY